MMVSLNDYSEAIRVISKMQTERDNLQTECDKLRADLDAAVSLFKQLQELHERLVKNYKTGQETIEKINSEITHIASLLRGPLSTEERAQRDHLKARAADSNAPGGPLTWEEFDELIKLVKRESE